MKYLMMLLLLVPLTVYAKPKTGTIRVTVNPALAISIDGQSGTPINYREIQLPPGAHVVSILLPDRTLYTKTINVEAGHICCLDLVYTAPTVHEIIKTIEVPKEVIKVEKETCVELPQPKLFDACCDCRRDEVKARLDALAVELGRDPRLRVRVVAGSDWLVDYLVVSRGVDRGRIDYAVLPRLTVAGTELACVQMWLIQ